MQKLINLNDYLLSYHAANNMVRMLDYLRAHISNMNQEDIMEKFNLRTDIEYYQFMVDLSGFSDSYIEFSSRFQTDETVGNKKSIKKGGN